MAVNCASASSQSLTCSSAVFSGAVGTIVGWFKPTTTATEMYLAGLGNSATASTEACASYRGDQSPKAIRGKYGDTSTQIGYSTSTGVTTSTWHHFANVLISISSRKAYLDAGGVVSESTTINGAPAYNKTTIGKTATSGTAKFLNGDIGHVGFYSIALSASDLTNLANGYNCLDVQRSSLLALWDLWDINDLTDKVGNFTFTTVNSPTTASTQPPVDFGHRGAIQYSFLRSPDSQLWTTKHDLFLPPAFPSLPSVPVHLDRSQLGVPAALFVASTNVPQGPRVDIPIAFDGLSRRHERGAGYVDGNLARVIEPLPFVDAPGRPRGLTIVGPSGHLVQKPAATNTNDASATGTISTTDDATVIGAAVIVATDADGAIFASGNIAIPSTADVTAPFPPGSFVASSVIDSPSSANAIGLASVAASSTVASSSHAAATAGRSFTGVPIALVVAAARPVARVQAVASPVATVRRA